MLWVLMDKLDSMQEQISNVNRGGNPKNQTNFSFMVPNMREKASVCISTKSNQNSRIKWKKNLLKSTEELLKHPGIESMVLEWKTTTEM